MKTCRQCKETKAKTEFWYNAKRKCYHALCTPCRLARAAEWRAANKEQNTAYMRAWQQANPDKVRIIKERFALKNPGYGARKTREWYAQPENRARQLARDREAARRLKDRVFQAYGGWQCACCKESEPRFLTIDHVNNDGAQHRRQMGEKRGGRKFYEWLVTNGFPSGFQVLCMNCNWGKARNHGVCPHQSPEGSSTIPKNGSTAEASTSAVGSARHPEEGEDIVTPMQRCMAAHGERV